MIIPRSMDAFQMLEIATIIKIHIDHGIIISPHQALKMFHCYILYL